VDQTDLLRHVVAALEKLDLPYVLVGSIASGAYGEPRLTRDIDVVVKLLGEQVKPLCKAFPSPDYYVSLEAAREAVRRGGQFNVIHPGSGNKVDFIIARNDAWGRMQMQRRQKVRVLPDLEGCAAAPEDLILGKMLYYQEGGSEKHLRDIAGVMKVSAELVDTSYVAEWAEELGVAAIWAAILERLGQA